MADIFVSYSRAKGDAARMRKAARIALERTEKIIAADPGSKRPTWPESDSDFDPIREDPRFQKLTQQARQRLASQ